MSGRGEAGAETGRAWVEVDLSAVVYNARVLGAMLPPGCRLMPVVKADAYGHGAVEVSLALANAGARDFCVATVDEGAELREHGVEGRILVLGHTHGSQLRAAADSGLTLTVADARHAGELGSWARSRETALDVEVAVDTGMRRLGVGCDDAAALAWAFSQGGLRVRGVWSHLCTSDGSSPAERAVVREQADAFARALALLKAAGVDLSGVDTHLQASHGILNHPGLAADLGLTAARPGIALYGAAGGGAAGVGAAGVLRPALALKARVTSVREVGRGQGVGYGHAYAPPCDMRLATVSAGYADGVPRALSNRGMALLGGVAVPVVGRVCMDQLCLDVTRAPGAAAGDEVVLVGASGERRLRAEQVAAQAGTIANELLCGLGPRLPRIYTPGPAGAPGARPSRPAFSPALLARPSSSA